MSKNIQPGTDNSDKKQGKGCLRTLGIMLLTVVISVLATVFVINYYLFPKKFDPVQLNPREETTLNKKLQQFGFPALSGNDARTNKDEQSTSKLEPEPYSEEGAKREVTFSEKELNAMLAKNTDLADKMAIDLSENLASAKVIMPIDPDFPLLGGKTLKASAGAELAYRDGRPVIILKGVKVWGVPIPNAWLGNLKNVDLVQEFGGDEGFWKSFADGVENISVSDGQLIIKLKE
jgi:hypothetical protein